jgi:hypothetical protein
MRNPFHPVRRWLLVASAAALLGATRAAPEDPATRAGASVQAPRAGALRAESSLASRVDAARAAAAVRTLVGFGPRMGGTASGARASEWLASELRGLGLEVEVLEDPEKWCHAERRWSAVAARATGATGANGERIALERAWPWGFSPSSSGAARLALEPAAGAALLAARLPRGDVQPALALIDGSCTRDGAYPVVRHLREGQDQAFPVFGISSSEGQRLRAWLDAGSEVTVEWVLESEIARARPLTVVARLGARPGAPPGELLYCAHADSDAGGPGADDNASGEAVVLEIARAWCAALAAGEVERPERALAFAFWGSEIHSSRAYLEHSGAAILGVINYDQAGFGSGADQVNVEPDDLDANRALVLAIHGALADHAAEPGWPPRWATNKSLGGTDSYVFSRSALFREGLRPAVTVFSSAWGEPAEHPRTAGMPGESWGEREHVSVDYDNYYHSAGDTPENTTDQEPFNMAWCARAGLAGGLRWLGGLAE